MDVWMVIKSIENFEIGLFLCVIPSAYSKFMEIHNSVNSNMCSRPWIFFKEQGLEFYEKEMVLYADEAHNRDF